MSDKTKRVSIDVSVDVNDANRALDNLAKKLANISTSKVDLKINVNKGQYTSQINQINSTVKKLSNTLNKNLSNIKVGFNTRQAEADINNFTANLTGTFGKIENMSKQSSDRMAKSFTNSFKGISNISNEIKNAFSKLNGSKLGNKFGSDFVKSIKSKMKTLGSSNSDMGGLVKSMKAIGLASGLSFAKSFMSATKNLGKSINDAIDKDYSVNLNAKGLKGMATNFKIDSSGMGKELKAVTKMASNSLLDFSKTVKNIVKVIEQAGKYFKANSEKIFKSLGKSADKLSKSKNPFVSQLGGIIKELIPGFKSLIRIVGSVAKVLQPLVNALQPLARLLSSVLGLVAAVAKKLEILAPVVNTVANLLSKLADALSRGINRITKVVDKTPKSSSSVSGGSGAKDVLSKAFNVSKASANIVKALVSGITGKISAFAKVGMKIGKAIAGGIRKVVGLFKGVINFITKAILGPIGLVLKVGRAIGNAIFKGIKAVFSIAKIGINIIKSIVSGITRALSLVINAGKMIANALIKGVKAVAGLIKLGATIAKNIITGITRAVKSFVNIGLTIGRAIVRGVTSAVKFVGSFAKTFVNLGLNISKAIGRGIKAGLGFVTNAIKTLTKGIMAPIKLMGKTITSTIGTAFTISKSVMGGIGNTIMEALDGDHTIELELVPSTGNILGSLFDKRDVTNQLKRDLSVITQTMPKELGQVTNAFGAKILDAGAKVQRYANLMLQAYDFVRSNKGVITSTFQKLYNTMAPTAKRIMVDLGVVLRDYGQKAMLGLKSKMAEKISPVIEPFKNVLDVVKSEFTKVKDNLTGFSGQLKDAVSNVKNRIGDIVESLKDLSSDIKGRFTQIVDSFFGVIDSAKVSFKTIIGDFGGVSAIIKAKLEDSSSMFGQIAGIAKRKMDDALDTIKGKIGNVINVIKEKMPLIMESVTNLAGVVIANLKIAIDKIIEIFNKFKPSLMSVIDAITNFVKNLKPEDFKNAFNKIKDVINKIVKSAQKIIYIAQLIAEFVKGFLTGFFSPVILAGKVIMLFVRGLKLAFDGLKKFGGFLSGGVKNIFSSIRGWISKQTEEFDYEGAKEKLEEGSMYTHNRNYDNEIKYSHLDAQYIDNDRAKELIVDRKFKYEDYMEAKSKETEAMLKGSVKDTKKWSDRRKKAEFELHKIDLELVQYLYAHRRSLIGEYKNGSKKYEEKQKNKTAEKNINTEIEDLQKELNDFNNTTENKFNFETIKQGFDDVFTTISEAGEEIKEAAINTEKFSAAAGTAAESTSGIKDSFKGMGSLVDEFANEVKESFVDFGKSMAEAFDSEPIQKSKEAIRETKKDAEQLADTVKSSFDGVSVDKLRESVTEAFGKDTAAKIRETVEEAFNNDFTNTVKDSVVKAAEEAKRVATEQASPERLAQAKSNLKGTGNAIKQKVILEAETKLFQQKLDGAFKSVRHPISALKEEISAKLGKVHINLTVKGQEQAKKAVNDVYNAMQKFKSAKGSEKLTAGIDVAIQSIKYKLITLKNTMKENFVSNLINKMSGKAKKASKELAENVPGGAKTIGFFKSSLGKLSLLLGGFGIGAYIKQATDLALQYEASAMQIQRSLGSASQKIMDFAQNSAAALGISQTQAMEYGNKFSLMVRQFETDTDKIANTTNALMQAAAITASATGTELSTVMDSFQSALTGSSEAVDQYGLNMKIANLEARLGIDNWNDLTVAQQQFYITQELINQTTANFGNKSLKNTNSMLAQFKAQLSNTSLALGKTFKALLTVVLPYLTAFLKVLETVFNYISTMITSLLSLFGITVDFTSNAASGIEAVGGDVDTSGLDGVSDGMDNVAEGADNAADSVEKMKGSLAGFDELNTLSFSDNSGSEGAGDIPAGGIDTSALDSGLAELGESDSALDKLQEKFKGFFDWIKKLIERIKELAKLFKEGFDLSFDYSKLKDIWESLKSIGESLKYIFFNEEVAAAINRLADRWAFAMGQIVGAIANIGASIIQMFLGGIAKSLDENKDWIKEKLITCIDVTGEIWTLLGNFAQALSEIFGVLGEEEGQGIIANIVSGLTYAFGTHAEIMLKLGRDIVDLITGPIVDNVEAIKENFKSFLGTIESITGTIKDAIKSVCDTISQTYDEKISPTLKLLRDGFSDTMAKFQEVYAEYIQPVLDALAERFDEVMKVYITPALNNLVSLFGTVIEVLGVLYETILKPLIDFIVQVIVPTAMPLLESAFNVIITVVGVVIGIIGDLLGVLDGFLTFLVGVFQGDWDKAWGGLQKCSESFFKIFTDLWEGLKSILLDGKFFESVKNFFKGSLEFIKGRFEWFRDKVGDTAEEAWGNIKKPFELMGQWFKDTWTKAYELATGAWSNIGTWASELPTKILNGISGLATSMASTFSSAWTACKNAFSGVATWASGLASTIGDKFRNLGSTVGEAIGGAVKAAINGVISTIEKTINGAIGLINSAIGLINKIPGVSISSISTVSLPRLASGGLVTSSTLANIGEAGPEAVIPLNRSNLWAPQLASELAKQLRVSGINQSNTSSRPLEVKLVVDGRELGRASINNINKLQRESNEILLDI